MIELERTFLVKFLPPQVKEARSKEMVDIYYPNSSAHPTIRLRKNGERYELTKKEPIEGDTTRMLEQTIELRKNEFDEFSKLSGRKLEKIRYYFPYDGLTAELDVFQGDLKGLVLADFEFASQKEKESFQMPVFCLAEVNHEERLAGGMLGGKKFEDIQ